MSALPPTPGGIDLAALRQRLGSARGRSYWRSLEELAQSPEFAAFVKEEFPGGAEVWQNGVSRRRFLQLMAASMALAGLHGCTRQPEGLIVPYVHQPDGVTPGKPLFFATADSLGGIGRGLLVTSHEGRPTHVDGNADHPASPGPYEQAAARIEAGAADVFAQASLLELYDPDRSQSVKHLGVDEPWDSFVQAIHTNYPQWRQTGGLGLRLLTRTITSPTLAEQIQTLLTQLPNARWHQYEPINRDMARAGAILALGRDVYTRYAFDRADIVVALDADFLGVHPLAMRYSHDFMSRRRFEADPARMNRLYAIETTFSSTGAVADHRLALRPSQVERFARALGRRLGAGETKGLRASDESNLPTDWLDAIAEDLQAHRGAGLVVAGETQPAAVHALAHLMNHALGNVGRTVIYTEPIAQPGIDHSQSLRELTADIDAELVRTLVILEANPVYEAPADMNFAERLARVAQRIHLGLYVDETAAMCHWHINQAHPLETWGDTRSFDGTASIVQPLIAPLYDGKSTHEVMSVLLDQPTRTAHEIVKGHWSGVTENSWRLRNEPGNFERFWRHALHDGVIPDTQLDALVVEPRADVSLPPQEAPAGPVAGELEIQFKADPTVWDGRFANNGWLQELPKPMTKLTWDNALLLSPATAEVLGVQTEALVTLQYRGRTLDVAVFVMPGHADGAATLALGYGRWQSGNVGTGAGFNAYKLRTGDAPWGGGGLTLRLTDGNYRLACTQGHQRMEGRDLVHHETLAEHLEELRSGIATDQEGQENIPEARGDGEDAKPLAAQKKSRSLALYAPFSYAEGEQWGMNINLSTCVGCNACIVACQQENNIAVVGKTEVINERAMHWIRVDRYFEGGPDQPDAHFEPLTCMHCENAPCEVVCPVGATQHSKDGLNEMIYNRCIGTRYCSNNCPYKVRRFNFLQWIDESVETYKLMRNPEVTVRSRGVMEKCSYCVQRIAGAKIHAQIENRPILDGETATACQTACPTESIVLGNINDPSSKVARRKNRPDNYGLLTELNTRPRTTYLARVRNLNPRLKREGEA